MIEFEWPLLGVAIPASLIALCTWGTYVFVLVPENDASHLWWHWTCAVMVTLSYTLAIIKDPGSVPETFEPATGELRRWCVKCRRWKPERTHHCRKCGKCVLKMDHHCPWTYNCVGHNNMPYFLRFLWWTIVGVGSCLYHVVGQAMSFYSQRHMPSYLIDKTQLAATIVLAPTLAFLLLSISLLVIRVVWNMVDGKTQIEVWECERIEAMQRRKRRRGEIVEPVEFPYDIDLVTNIYDAWGPSILLWLWPWGQPSGDGLHFQKNEAGDQRWPPDHDSSPEGVKYTGSAPTLGYVQRRGRVQNQDPNLNKHEEQKQNQVEEPEWRRGLTSETDFYRSDQWANYEGERLSDFGVDPDTIR